MKTYNIRITVGDNPILYHKVEVSGNTPVLLEDAIKAAVKEFYKEDK